MTEREQRSKTILLLIAAALVLAALILHNIPARAATDCRLVTVAYPKMQISMVSKVCWETEIPHVSTVDVLPAAVIENPPVPPQKPCKMKGRVRYADGCFLPRRHKLMHKRK